MADGCAIQREVHAAETWTCRHVELAEQSLGLAEGVSAETFVGDAGRLASASWAEEEALHPEDRPIQEMARPRARPRRQMPKGLRERLDAVAEAVIATAA